MERVEPAERCISIVEAVAVLVSEELFRKLQKEVDALTAELKEKSAHLDQALDQIQVLQTRLQSQERLATLGGLTAGIVHEVRNPLNFISNFAEICLDQVEELLAARPDPRLQEVRANLDCIRRHGRQAEELMQTMLSHARAPAASHWQEVDVNQMLDELARLVASSFRIRNDAWPIQLQTDLDPEAGRVEGVAEDLGRVVVNVVDNACYSCYHHARRLQSGRIPTIAVQSRGDGERVEIRIRDNGSGIPLEIRERIFDPFFTTKPSGEGTGLGLAMARDIVVEQHGGRLDVHCEEGSFTEFVMVLPRRRPGAPMP